MNRISLTIPSPQDAALRALAKETGLPINELVRRALSEFLKENKAGVGRD